MKPKRISCSLPMGSRGQDKTAEVNDNLKRSLHGVNEHLKF
ncbi:Uncharacterised protein [Legionella israelensis]|nr:hypothetical protein SAMN02746069_00419 [Legionella israelensis DSM 19235]STX57601.1 Uncharacterised protein [Legionella israelensis]